MKLNLNAKELLALHNMLFERLDRADCREFGSTDDVRAADEIQLRQLYGRIRALLIGSLTNRSDDPVETWFTSQQAKVNDLRRQNEEIKKVAVDFGSTDPASVVASMERVIADDDYEKDLSSYPRRAPHPSMPKPHKRKR